MVRLRFELYSCICFCNQNFAHRRLFKIQIWRTHIKSTFINLSNKIWNLIFINIVRIHGRLAITSWSAAEWHNRHRKKKINFLCTYTEQARSSLYTTGAYSILLNGHTLLLYIYYCICMWSKMREHQEVAFHFRDKLLFIVMSLT